MCSFSLKNRSDHGQFLFLILRYTILERDPPIDSTNHLVHNKLFRVILNFVILYKRHGLLHIMY